MTELTFFAVAFACGYVILQLGLPPLIGFLAAGFLLSGFGFENTDALNTLADLGVTLLLFTIGLKLKIKALLRPQVWGPATLHLLACCVVFGLGFWLLAALSLPMFSELSLEGALLLAFAFSFSSTVFAVKVLEERGEMSTLHAQIAIGVLVMQDVFAVLFLAASTGKLPNAYALVVIAALTLGRPLIFRLLNGSRHGEVLPLFGFVAALVLGYQGFEWAGMKGDLGALIVGMVLAPHNKAGELAKSLMQFKDLFLVGFFLTVGLNAHIKQEAFIVVAVLLMLLPIKIGLYYFFLTSFKLRARTALQGSLTLANYSEFGLIVGAIAQKMGLISADWLAVAAIALAATFVIASPLNARANSLYSRFEYWLHRAERSERLPEELPVHVEGARVLIFGMGRIGAGAYDSLLEHYGTQVAGVDANPDVIEQHQQQGRFAIVADATDPDFWQRINHSEVQLILLAMPKHAQNLYALEQLRASGFAGKVAAIANHSDQQQELNALGIDSTFNFYAEAGAGFAQHVCDSLPRV